MRFGCRCEFSELTDLAAVGFEFGEMPIEVRIKVTELLLDQRAVEGHARRQQRLDRYPVDGVHRKLAADEDKVAGAHGYRRCAFRRIGVPDIFQP